MLNQNIKALRKAKGLSQEELAIKLNVVRQTVSKWERGLSVPDARMVIQIAEVLDTTVSILTEEEIPKSEDSYFSKTLAAKFGSISHNKKRQLAEGALSVFSLLIALVFLVAYFRSKTYELVNFEDAQFQNIIYNDNYARAYIFFLKTSIISTIVLIGDFVLSKVKVLYKQKEI